MHEQVARVEAAAMLRLLRHATARAPGGPLAHGRYVADRIRELCAWPVFAPTTDDVPAAIALHQQAKLSFWDAMVVHAAAESGCDVLWTEDLKDGQVLRGVQIRNPFAG